MPIIVITKQLSHQEVRLLKWSCLGECALRNTLTVDRVIPINPNTKATITPNELIIIK